jgi:hypothetical protein
MEALHDNLQPTSSDRCWEEKIEMKPPHPYDAVTPIAHRVLTTSQNIPKPLTTADNCCNYTPTYTDC